MAESEPLTFVLRVLDRAIADVAREEYRRLTEGMRPEDREKFVGGALDDLNNKLGRGISPNYKSEWIALFYLAWYQPRQVLLAYAALRHVFDNLKQKPPRRIIDFGCGSWAVQTALSILIAENSPSQNVAVYGIDSSEPMMRIGRDLWRKFNEMVRDSARGSSFARKLRRTLDLMVDSCNYNTSYEAFTALHAARGATSPDDCWLTAIHATYPSNRNDIETVFRRIRKEHEPVIELVTFYDRYDDGNPRPFYGELGFTERKISSFLVEENSLMKITQWRKELLAKLKNLSNWRLLTKSVPWNLKGDEVVMIRSKK